MLTLSIKSSEGGMPGLLPHRARSITLTFTGKDRGLGTPSQWSMLIWALKDDSEFSR